MLFWKLLKLHRNKRSMNSCCLHYNNLKCSRHFYCCGGATSHFLGSSLSPMESKNKKLFAIWTGVNMISFFLFFNYFPQKHWQEKDSSEGSFWETLLFLKSQSTENFCRLTNPLVKDQHTLSTSSIQPSSD